jgi:ribosomal protein S18 acetylase RimI-like enzyme
MQLLKTNKLKQSELKQIVDIHLKELNESFLNNFGSNFLEVIYPAIFFNKNNICLLVLDKESVVGFLVATKDGDRFNQDLIKEKFYLLSKEIIRSSIKNPLLLVEIVKWKMRPPNDNKIKPELQFIAIKKDYQNKGLGKKLITELNKEFRKAGIKEYRVGTKADNLNSNRFYQHLGFKDFYKDDFFGDKFNYYLAAI